MNKIAVRIAGEKKMEMMVINRGLKIPEFFLPKANKNCVCLRFCSLKRMFWLVYVLIGICCDGKI